MQFNGFLVDNIGSFRKYFSLKDLLESLDIQVVFLNWLETMLKSGGLDTHTEASIQHIQKAFFCWIKDLEDSNINQIILSKKETQKTSFESMVFRLEKEIIEEKKYSYWTLCFILCELLEISEYKMTEEDEELIYNFFVKQGLLTKDILKIHVKKNREVILLFKDNIIAEFLPVNTKLYEEKNIIIVSEHPDCGYLGITKEGKLYNASAYQVPEIQKKAVKVCMNQGGYIILLEDGSIVHNFRFSNLPIVPMKNIDLYGEQILWELMD